MLACTLLTFALCANPETSSTIVVGQLTVPITWAHVAIATCYGVGSAAGGEAGQTLIETGASSYRTGPGTGRVVIRLSRVSIHLVAFTWPRMTEAEQAAMRELYQATLWHELGHVRTALDSADAINAGPDFSAPSESAYVAVADAHSAQALDRLDDEQNAYERLVSHGLRQSDAGPPLGGPDTTLLCPGP